MNITKTKTTITIELNVTDNKILCNDLLDPIEWIEKAVIEKLANCKSRLIEKETIKMIKNESVEFIPTDEIELLTLIFAQPDYKNRSEREQ